jgi:hypothetical protein
MVGWIDPGSIELDAVIQGDGCLAAALREIASGVNQPTHTGHKFS